MFTRDVPDMFYCVTLLCVSERDRRAMNRFTKLLSHAGLTAADAQLFLKLSQDRFSALEEGKVDATPREVQALRGVAIRKPVPTQKTNDAVAAAMPSQKPGIEASYCWPTKDTRLQSDISRAPSAARNPVRRRPSPKLTTLELCAGGGGTALGLEEANFSPVALLEKDAHACATLRKNRPYWNVIQADIEFFELDYWRDVDLLSGGLPCPPSPSRVSSLARPMNETCFRRC